MSLRKITYLALLSSETVSFFRPRALRRAITALPLAEEFLDLNPCLLTLLRREGWYVLFMSAFPFGSAKIVENPFPETLKGKNSVFFSQTHLRKPSSYLQDSILNC